MYRLKMRMGGWIESTGMFVAVSSIYVRPPSTHADTGPEPNINH